MSDARKSKKLAAIHEAIEDYYEALDKRLNGNDEQRRAFEKIEKILGLSWKQGETLKKRLREKTDGTV